MLFIILWASIFYIVPILYVQMKNEAKFKKNIVVGVTLPPEAKEDAKIQEILGRYVKELKLVSILFLLLIPPTYFIKDNFNIFMFVWLLWLDAVIIGPNLVYIRYNKILKSIKIENNWVQTQDRETISIDTSAIPTVKNVSAIVFIPAIILSLLPLLWDREMIIVYVCNAVSVLLCMVCYYYFYRNKSETFNDKIEITKALTRIRKLSWSKVWIISAYSLSLISFSFLFFKYSFFWCIASILFISIALCIIVVKIDLKTRALQEKLTQNASDSDWYVDDDDKWLCGIFYYNPKDSRTFVNNRVGVNSTLNLAKTTGKVYMIITAIILIIMPFSMFIIDGIFNKNIGLEINDTQIVSIYGKPNTFIDFEDIEKAELFEELPEKLSRSWGVGMDTLLEGRFYSPEYSGMYLCLDPTYPPFILIETEDAYYLLGSRDSNLTKKIYDSLLEKIK